MSVQMSLNGLGQGCVWLTVFLFSVHIHAMHLILCDLVCKKCSFILFRDM